MDTIGPLPEVMTFKLIIVFIDTFTRHVELFPINTVCVISECPMETHIQVLYSVRNLNRSGINHHMTIPYSKEENEIVEWAYKEVNRNI